MNILFCDVDGTLTGTVSGATFKKHPRDVQPLEGVEKALKHYKERGWKIVGISNQGGCAAIDKATGKPYKSIEEAIEEMQYTLELLPLVEAIYFCPDFKGYYCYEVTRNGVVKHDHSQKAALVPYANYDASADGFEWKLDPQDNFRKPNPGMLNLVKEQIKEIENAWMVGDRPQDDEGAAIAAKVNFCHADVWRDRFIKGFQWFDGMGKDLIWFLEGIRI